MCGMVIGKSTETSIAFAAMCLCCLFVVSCRNQTTRQSPEAPCSITEITLERTYSGCTDCRPYKIIVTNRSGNSDETVAVALTDLKTNQTRQGKLHKSTFEQLCKLIDTEHYFELSDTYGEGVVDSGDVTTSVLKNGARKTILNRAEKAPIGLWGIEMAIDGAIATVSWQSTGK